MKYQYEDKVFESKINAASLYREIMRNKYKYNGIDGFNEYLEKWYSVMLDTFKSEDKKEFVFKGLEQYYTEIIIPNCEIRIHFCISDAKKYISNYISQNIPLTDFATFYNGYAYVKYNDVSCENGFDYSKCNEPIIAIEYQFDGFDYLVIDGNHRLSFLSKNKIKDSVDVILLPLKDTLNLIYSEFEKSLYLFLFEGAHIEEGYYLKNSATKYYHNGKFSLPL
jgi:hypothetical protein